MPCPARPSHVTSRDSRLRSVLCCVALCDAVLSYAAFRGAVRCGQVPYVVTCRAAPCRGVPCRAERWVAVWCGV
eukprot:10925986-Alexandrium_andersonii.AAC.1